MPVCCTTGLLGLCGKLRREQTLLRLLHLPFWLKVSSCHRYSIFTSLNTFMQEVLTYSENGQNQNLVVAGCTKCGLRDFHLQLVTSKIEQ